MEYLETQRLKKLRNKCLRDMEVAENETKKSIQENYLVSEDQMVTADPTKSTYQDSYVRWRNEPDLLASSIKDPCVKRREMAL